eukprot:2705671-Pleurochrysis_carterae.AAC.3
MQPHTHTRPHRHTRWHDTSQSQPLSSQSDEASARVRARAVMRLELSQSDVGACATRESAQTAPHDRMQSQK